MKEIRDALLDFSVSENMIEHILAQGSEEEWEAVYGVIKELAEKKGFQDLNYVIFDVLMFEPALDLNELRNNGVL